MNPLDVVFARLREIMLEGSPGQIIDRDEPGDLVLLTGRVEPKTGKPDWFGAVNVKKNYVAYHLMPIYNDPSLAANISNALSKRRQGKSCFNFKTVDPALFAELASLTRNANREAGS